MPVFQYKARGPDGKMVTGLADAPSQEAAIKLLHTKQLFVVGIGIAGESFSFAQVQEYFKRVTFNDIVNFTRQLATMVVAGLSLPEALTILRTQTTNQIFSDVLMDIE